MALILHIADLHLVSPADSRPVDDHKVGLVPSGDRTTHHDMLRLTLQRLSERLINDGRVLDAIAVTGDIADKNNEGGYGAFLELIEALGPVKPPPNRIVVSPGNHDVAMALLPGDPRRYDEFVRFVRDAGFVTPLLMGVDPLPVPAADAARHLVTIDDIQIIPIDSAAYSQVRLDVGISDPSWASLEAALGGSPAELTALRKLRIVDAARVSDPHLEALRQLLEGVPMVGPPPLRIGALHHHLLPVSVREEVKPFESLSNLGLLRQFLRDQGIAIVLHGHKHTRFTYVDYISSYDIPLHPPTALRVLSGAAASGGDMDRADVFRLIDVQPRSGVLRIERVSASAPGLALTVSIPETLTFSRPGAAQIVGTSGCTVIDGPTVGVVYPQLVATVAGRAGELDHVVCRIEHAPELEQIAPLYPGLAPTPGTPEAEDEPGVAAKHRLDQFRDLVRWWQYPSAPVSPWDHPAFTHGSRIKKYSGHLNQIQAVIGAIEADHTTSRGIIVLLTPEADKIADQDVPFPSFCLVQFRARSTDAGSPASLECTAYFRKQEVRYWWLVNLAELAELQREICDSLRQRRVQELRNIRPGTITTIAARAHAGQSAPKVQVPRIDRNYSLERQRLFGMVNALIWEHMPGRDAYGAEWLRSFFELNPPEAPDADGVPIAHEGLKYLTDEVGRHLASKQYQDDVSLRELHHALEQLLAANQAFALLQQKEEANEGKYNSWRATVKPLIARVIELSYGRITATPRSAH